MSRQEGMRTMSSTQSLFILALVAGGISLAVWLLLRLWSPEQLPLLAGLIAGLLAVIALASLLPMPAGWGETPVVAQVMLGVIVMALSVKCLILLVRHGGTLSPAGKWAAYFGLTPLLLGVFLILALLWSMGFFSKGK
jgi:hypothetical protein